MIDFFSSRSGLVVGAFGLGLAAIILTALILRPGIRRLPMSRRRYLASEPVSSLSAAANVATAAVDRILGPRKSGLAAALENAGAKMAPRDLVFIVLAGVLACFAGGLLLRGPLLGLVLALLPPMVAWLGVRFRTTRRRQRFGDQMDESLQMMAGSLRAGYSLAQAVDVLGAEAEAPTSEEFARITNETRVGRPLTDNLLASAQRMRNDDFYWVVQAISINREVGGNLADVLDGVAGTIRERVQLRRQVRALSAEGRISAIILMALPFVVIGFLMLVNPGYFGKFLESGIGVLALVFSGVMLLLGAIWLRAIVNIKF